MEYPDNASVEEWNDGPGMISRDSWDQTLPDDPKKTPYFLESEVISPFAQLDPGEEYSFTVQWSPTRAPNPIRNTNWAGAISETFSAKAEGAKIQLKGVFGVFTPGTIEAVFYNNMGEEMTHEILQAVDPREVVRIDKSVPLPEGAFRVSILVRDSDGENRGFLGNVVLK
jgi:hypothetical protein